MYGALDISTSGLIAQRTRLTVAAANIANADTLVDSQGEPNPYRRRFALLAPGPAGAPPSAARAGKALGVHVQEIAQDQSPFKLVYDPGHPLAAKEDDPARGLRKGYVRAPNVDRTIEQINVTEALRAYEANIAAAEATKTMMASALQLLA